MQETQILSTLPGDRAATAFTASLQPARRACTGVRCPPCGRGAARRHVRGSGAGGGRSVWRRKPVRLACPPGPADRRGPARHAGVAGRRLQPQAGAAAPAHHRPVSCGCAAGALAVPGPAACWCWWALRCSPWLASAATGALLAALLVAALVLRAWPHTRRHHGPPDGAAVAHSPTLPVQHPQQCHRPGARGTQGRVPARGPERPVPPRAGRAGRGRDTGRRDPAGAALPGHRTGALWRPAARAVAARSTHRRCTAAPAAAPAPGGKRRQAWRGAQRPAASCAC